MYEFRNGCTYRQGPDGDELLCNFIAEITQETHYLDDQNRETILTIAGRQQTSDGEIILPEVEVPTDAFQSMSWVLKHWGVRAVLQPGSGVKDSLRTAIQLTSKPKVTSVYTHTGWTETKDGHEYLHARGSVTKRGLNPTRRVNLPPELERFDLSTADLANATLAAQATLDLHKIAPPEIAWPMLAATIAPVLGPCDFAIHVAGRTGTFKSELCSLFQSHYGPRMDARHLPAAWSSTGNALEALAHRAKNAVLVVDDFIPVGTSWQVKSYQKNADQIVRAQGNQAGRARLTDTSRLQTTMYPRGLVMSSGEDIPEGHSVRARMLILDLSPGMVKPAILTDAQKARGLYHTTMAAFIQYIASFHHDMTERVAMRATELRDSMLDVGHSRTPAMLGRLIASIEMFIQWAALIKAISPETERALIKEATAAIKDAGDRQDSFLQAADPCDTFVETIRKICDMGQGHFRSIRGGVPRNAGLLGWLQTSAAGDLPMWQAQGKTIGWVNSDEGELYIDSTSGVEIIKKAAGNTLTKQTLMKRLKDSGHLLRTDDARQRNTVRAVCDGHPRQVLVFALSQVIESQEDERTLLP